MIKYYILTSKENPDPLDGDMFYGTIDQWKDCFFSNPAPENMEDFAEKHGCTLTEIEKEI